MIKTKYDVIHIKNLKIDCIIGMLPKERENPQRLLIDVELYTDFSKVMETDSVEDTLNYAEVSDLLTVIAKESKSQMIEFLAGKMVNSLFENYSDKLFGVKIKLYKPDILPNTEKVGIEITRYFKELL
ncbi:MAG: dihydroneopterin aldolase [Succinivibrionaceae bacterium]